MIVKKTFLFGLAICFVLAVLFVMSGDVDSQSNGKDSKSTAGDNFPLVTFQAKKRQPGQSEQDEIRNKRNEKFKEWGWVRSTVDKDVKSVILNNHWQNGLSPLPVAKSDAIILGRIDSAEAFLSSDQTGVYSEFQVNVGEIFKNNNADSLEILDSISVERAGGRVKYPSGDIVKYVVRGQEMPRLTRSYVLFLVFDADRATYHILTAYEVLDGKIFALDGNDGSEQAGWVFKKLNNSDEDQFRVNLKFDIFSVMQQAQEKTP